MNSCIDVVAIVEGKTEQIFVESILAPYLAKKMIFMVATQVTKPGQKGGDVRFSRVTKDIGSHLKQRPDTYVTTFVDYYGTKEWPGIDSVVPNLEPDQIAKYVNEATQEQVNTLFAEQQAERRFIPYMAIHEFEALLFSDGELLAAGLGIDEAEISAVLAQYSEPEAINNSAQTAPSKRLDGWSKTKKFPKTSLGIAIAGRIGIPQMRESCSVFNAWIGSFEAIVEAQA
ncbi:MAG: DUF4276 family protein [Pseudomonadales bacterium]|nr:DUF4276 family protein [Pseudomonadales bacterium]